MLMRLAVAVLALLAGGKIVWQEHTTRTALKETVADAFRERAIRACDQDTRVLKIVLPLPGWSAVESIRVRVESESFLFTPSFAADKATGRAQPVLVLSLNTPTGGYACTYNVVTGTATVERG